MLNSRRICLYKLFIDPIGIYWVVEYMFLSYEQGEVTNLQMGIFTSFQKESVHVYHSVSSFKRKFAVWHVAQLVDYLLSMHEVLGSPPVVQI